MGSSQAARRGRPPMDVAPSQPENEITDRRLRMRLAQRAYRSRKAMVLDQEKARSEKLSLALDRVTGVFGRFHRQIAESSQAQYPPYLLAHLNEVAKEMAAVVQDAKNDHLALDSLDFPLEHHDPRLLQNSNTVSTLAQTVQRPHEADEDAAHISNYPARTSSIPGYNMVTVSLLTQQMTHGSLEHMILSACVEQTIFVLSNLNPQSWYPALTVPLQLLGEELAKLAILGTRWTICDVPRESAYPPDAFARLPKMYRVVEGENTTIPRLRPPYVQKLRYGKTRTRLWTDVPALQGEWMESSDVEEYLQERGIDAKNNSPTVTMNLGKSPVISSDPNARHKQIPSEWQILFSEASSQNGHSRAIYHRAGRGTHETSDFSVFGIATNQPPIILPPFENTKMRSGSAEKVMTTLGPEFPVDNGLSPSPIRIVLDLDQLTRILAASAMCLGSIPGIRRESVDDAIRRSVIKFERIEQATLH